MVALEVVDSNARERGGKERGGGVGSEREMCSQVCSQVLTRTSLRHTPMIIGITRLGSPTPSPGAVTSPTRRAAGGHGGHPPGGGRKRGDGGRRP